MQKFILHILEVDGPATLLPVEETVRHGAEPTGTEGLTVAAGTVAMPVVMLVVLAVFSLFTLLSVILGQGTEDGAAKGSEHTVTDFVTTKGTCSTTGSGTKETAVCFGALCVGLAVVVVRGIGCRLCVAIVGVGVATGIRVVGLRVLIWLLILVGEASTGI